MPIGDKHRPRRMPFIVIGILVIAVVVSFARGSSERAEEAGRFADAETCYELFAAFEAEPASDNAAERAAVGNEYRARFRQLDCT